MALWFCLVLSAAAISYLVLVDAGSLTAALMYVILKMQRMLPINVAQVSIAIA